MIDWFITMDFALRMLLAGFLGALFGVERDLHARPAGLRTLMLIAMGSCLFGIISSEGYVDEEGNHDPSRIASIVVQGIGFLGASVVIKGGNKIVGITTAATIWLVAAIGLAIGAGMVAEAIAVSIASIAAIVTLNPLSNWFEKIGNKHMKRKGHRIIHKD